MELGRRLAFGDVREVPLQLAVHVGNRVEQGLFGLAEREGRVVGPSVLVVEEQRDDVRAGRALHVGEQRPEQGGQPRVVGFERRLHEDSPVP